jgi:hypothetical protein
MWWAIWDALSRSRAGSKDALKDTTRLPIALAQARERVVQAHMGQAAELVELSRGRMTPERAIETYCRLALLGPDSSGEVRTRVLAALAKAGEGDRESPGMPEWLARRRGRLDGMRRRRDDEMRDWVELHTARSRSVVIEAHVRSALELVDIMSGRLSRSQAIALYLKMGNVPGHLAREVDTFALERLARRHLPIPMREPEAGESPASEDARAEEEAAGGGAGDSGAAVPR